MRDRFFILIGKGFPARVEWYRVAGNEALSTSVKAEQVSTDDSSHNGASTTYQAGVSALSDIAVASSGCQVIVFVPGTDVTLTSARVPSKQRQHILNAVPYALEDQLASDIDSLHFAMGPRNDEGIVPVAVVAMQQMGGWMSQLRGAGVEPDVLLPDIFGLPLNPRAWTLVQDDERFWLRWGAYNGLVVEGQDVQQWLDLTLAEQEQQPQQIRWYTTPAVENDVPTYQSDTITIEHSAEDKTPLQFFAEHFSDGHYINLIQGDYSQREQFGRLLRPWRQAAVLVLVLIMLGFGGLVIDYFSLSAASNRLSGQINQVYLDTFPEAKKVVDAPVQMQQKLIELGVGDVRAGGGFLPLLGRIGATIGSADSVDLRHASYQAGRLSLSLRIKNLQLLEQLKSELVKLGGLAVEIQSAASRDGFVDARLQIEAA